MADVEIQLKWPNDDYVQRRKVSGILVEVPRVEPTRLVLGVGINVNNSLGAAPAEITDTATALCDVTGRPFPLVDVLICVLDKLANRLDWIGSRDRELRELWRERCLLTNRPVQIDGVGGQLAGVCQGIDEEGALVVLTQGGSRRCFAGTVTLLDC